MPDPDLEIRGWGGGGGWAVSKKNFIGPQFGLKIRDVGGGGAGPPRALPGSASVLFALSFFYPII